MLDKMLYKRGFSLVEITIVLLVLSVLAAGGLSVYQHHDSTSKTAVTLERIEAIERAFADFRSVQHRLPCPADPTLREHEAGFGAAGETPGHCRSGEIRAYARAGHTAVGAVPTRALGLPDSHMYDGWGRRFSYYVDSRVTGPMALLEYGAADECVGSIRVNDSTGTARTERAIYALVSHGLNGHGAFLPSGERRNANSSNAAERANAGVNAALADNYTQPLVKQRPTRNSSNHADSFDDIVRYKERWAIYGAVDKWGSGGSGNREHFTKIAIATSVSAHFACALSSRGIVYCWGMNTRGVVGVGGTPGATVYRVPTPVAMPITAGNAVDVQAASTHACILDNRGELYCWGHNTRGQLGVGDFDDRNVPTIVERPGGVSGWQKFYLGNAHSCAIAKEGASYCWGNNDFSVLGDGTEVQSPRPVAVKLPDGVSHYTELSISEQSISFGGNLAGKSLATTCGRGNNGEWYCWGLNDNGQLGGGSRKPAIQGGVTEPTRVLAPANVKFIKLVTGARSSCALGDNGRLYCWGNGWFGILGNNTTDISHTPVAVPLPAGASSFLSFSTFDYSLACATANNGKAYCWGDNRNGELGIGYTSTKELEPREVLNSNGMHDVLTGYERACGLKNKQMYCWGRANTIATGDNQPYSAPQPADTTARFDRLYMGGQHPGCALTPDGVGYCWGSGTLIGDGKTSPPERTRSPQPLDTRHFQTCPS